MIRALLIAAWVSVFAAGCIHQFAEAPKATADLAATKNGSCAQPRAKPIARSAVGRSSASRAASTRPGAPSCVASEARSSVVPSRALVHIATSRTATGPASAGTSVRFTKSALGSDDGTADGPAPFPHALHAPNRVSPSSAPVAPAARMRLRASLSKATRSAAAVAQPATMSSERLPAFAAFAASSSFFAL